MPMFKKLDGTTRREFIIGEGDVDVASDPAIGIRTTATGTVELKESGQAWAPIYIDPMTTRGDLIYRNASNVTARLSIGVADTYLKSDGTDVSWASIVVGGDVVGPTGATDNAVARYDTATGKLIQDSGILIDDSEIMSGVSRLDFASATSTSGDINLSDGPSGIWGYVDSGIRRVFTLGTTGSIFIGQNTGTGVTNDLFLEASNDVEFNIGAETAVVAFTETAATFDIPINGVTIEDHSARHENGGADEISVAGLSGTLADAQTPTQHALDSAILHSTPTDITTFNATTSAHGLFPKLSGVETEVLNGEGDWVIRGNAAAFPIWAEESASLSDSTYEWSYGNGDVTPSGSGVQIPFACELFAVAMDHSSSGSATVRVDKNGAASGATISTVAERNAYTTIGTPIAFAAGDIVNFYTVTGTGSADGNRVVAWFRANTGSVAGSNEIIVRKNSLTDVGTRPRLNFIEGTNITLTVADDGTDNEIDITIAAAGGGGTGDVVGPASSVDNTLVRFDGITGKLLQDSSIVIDDDGNFYMEANGSSTTDPRVFGAQNFSGGEAIRWEFGDTANFIQNSNGGAMKLGAYHTLILQGNRNTTSTPPFETTTDVSVLIPNWAADSPAFVVQGAASQSANLTIWRDSAASTLLSVDSGGNIVMAGTQTVDGVDVSAHASNTDAHHSQGHTVASHTDTSATGAQLNILVGGGETTLHSHAGVTAPVTTKGDLYTYTTEGARLPVGTDTQILVADSAQTSGLKWEDKEGTTVEFEMSEQLSNTGKYFFLWRASSAGTDSERSGSSGGLQNANSCSPYAVPFDATIVEAVLTVKGVGVQSGTVSYPVSYQTELRRMDAGANWGTPSTVADIDFSISNAYTVGTYAPGDTLATGIVTSLDVDVDQGQMLGLYFDYGADASTAAMTVNAYITLRFIRR